MNEDEFKAKYFRIIEKTAYCAEKARRAGLLALEIEGLLDEKKCLQRDIFELGLQLAIDGSSKEFLEKILNNLIDLEMEKDEKKLKIVQKEAVLAIRSCLNPRQLCLLLNSYVNIGLEETMKIFEEVDTSKEYNK